MLLEPVSDDVKITTVDEDELLEVQLRAQDVMF